MTSFTFTEAARLAKHPLSFYLPGKHSGTSLFKDVFVLLEMHLFAHSQALRMCSYLPLLQTINFQTIATETLAERATDR